MHEQLREKVEQMFADAPQSQKANELREEFYSNLYEKYDDLIKRGMSPDLALERVMNNIGDVDELIKCLEEETMITDPEKETALRKKNALFVTVCLLLYVFALIVSILMNAFHLETYISTCVFLILLTLPTAALIYHFMSRPRYKRQNDTLVEEFKEFTDKAVRDKQVWGSVIGAYWSIIVVLYFFLGFFFHAWAWSWLIFILAAAFQNILKAILTLRK